MSPREWDTIPWHERQMYLEGYEAEGLVRDADDSPLPYSPGSRPSTPAGELLDQRVHKDGDTTITERDTYHTAAGEPGEFAGSGFAVQRLG